MTPSPSSAQSEKVAPCPFCGCKIVGLGYIGQPAREIYAICYQCKATGPSQEYQTGMMFDFDATWNRRAAASAHTIGEDAANVAIGEREAFEAWYERENENARTHMDGDDWRELEPEERANYLAAFRAGVSYQARAALTAEKVAGQEPVVTLTKTGRVVDFDVQHGAFALSDGKHLLYAAPQPAQPIAQTLALTDEQVIAIEAAISISADIEAESHDGSFLSSESVQALRVLLADQSPAPASPSGEDAAEQAVASMVEPMILKGTGKINGDGWKDTTKIGEVVFVWNAELPRPYEPGQYPRIGNQCGWTASTRQYDFTPATLSEARSAIEGMLAIPQQPAQPVAQILALTDQVLTAARTLIREELDSVSVHPCDEHNDEVRSHQLPEHVRNLYRALLAAQPASSLAEGDKQ